MQGGARGPDSRRTLERDERTERTDPRHSLPVRRSRQHVAASRRAPDVGASPAERPCRAGRRRHAANAPGEIARQREHTAIGRRPVDEHHRRQRRIERTRPRVRINSAAADDDLIRPSRRMQRTPVVDKGHSRGRSTAGSCLGNARALTDPRRYPKCVVDAGWMTSDGIADIGEMREDLQLPMKRRFCSCVPRRLVEHAPRRGAGAAA